MISNTSCSRSMTECSSMALHHSSDHGCYGSVRLALLAVSFEDVSVGGSGWVPPTSHLPHLPSLLPPLHRARWEVAGGGRWWEVGVGGRGER